MKTCILFLSKPRGGVVHCTTHSDLASALQRVPDFTLEQWSVLLQLFEQKHRVIIIDRFATTGNIPLTLAAMIVEQEPMSTEVKLFALDSDVEYVDLLKLGQHMFKKLGHSIPVMAFRKLELMVDV